MVVDDRSEEAMERRLVFEWRWGVEMWFCWILFDVLLSLGYKIGTMDGGAGNRFF